MQGFRKPALLNSLFELEDNHDNNNLTNSNSSYFIQEVEVLEPKECSLLQLVICHVFFLFPYRCIVMYATETK